MLKIVVLSLLTTCCVVGIMANMKATLITRFRNAFADGSLIEVVIWHVQSWRQQGHALCVTVDAGPNPHVIALAEEREWALTALRALPGVMDVLVSPVGNGAQLVQAD